MLLKKMKLAPCIFAGAIFDHTGSYVLLFVMLSVTFIGHGYAFYRHCYSSQEEHSFQALNSFLNSQILHVHLKQSKDYRNVS